MITFADVGINYITDSLEIKRNQNHRNAPIIGQDGSDISFVSSDATVITFKSLCLGDEVSTDGSTNRINQYIQLSQTYNKTQAPLHIESVTSGNVDGEYFITGFDYTENTVGDFTIDWEFTKYIKFNVTKKTFRVWNKKQALSNAKKTANKGLDSNTKKLLKDCGTMKLGYINSCVKSLQIFLQSQGYYTKHKVDGKYYNSTVEAVKSLQKKYPKKLGGLKLKANGEWDDNTRTYFQIYFNYPNDISKGINAAANKSIQSSLKKTTTSKKKKK